MALEPKTKTFAEIYESQGHYTEALNIYIDLLKENPLDEETADSVKRLQSLIKEAGDGKKEAAETNAARNTIAETSPSGEEKRSSETQISALESFLQKTYAYKNNPA